MQLAFAIGGFLGVGKYGNWFSHEYGHDLSVVNMVSLDLRSRTFSKGSLLSSWFQNYLMMKLALKLGGLRMTLCQIVCHLYQFFKRTDSDGILAHGYPADPSVTAKNDEKPNP